MAAATALEDASAPPLFMTTFSLTLMFFELSRLVVIVTGLLMLMFFELSMLLVILTF